MDLTSHTIADHCNSTAFIFVPNICNAACQFCYVHPSLAMRANASRRVLSRARSAASALHELGFNEVRFTGGEPTVFSNLEAIVQPFLDYGMQYRILTNGISVEEHLPFFARRPPKRFTISVHDTVDPSSVFQVPITPRIWAENRRRLAKIAEVEATLVIRGTRHELARADTTLEDLARDNVSHVKLILENSRQATEAESFGEFAAHLADKWQLSFRSIRFTDTGQHACKLPEKAFPSIDLGRGLVFACCVQVGDRAVPSGYSGALPANGAGAARTIAAILTHSQRTTPAGLPCDPGTKFCPLGLTK